MADRPTDSPSRPDPPAGPQPANDLLPLIYDELRRLAQRHMARERLDHSLSPTALVHEAFLRIAGDREEGWASPRQFFAAAALAMRRILIEDARARCTARRGGAAGRQAITLAGIDLAAPECLEQVLAIDEVLCRLEQADPRASEVVRLRFYAGLSEIETATVLGLSARTVRREWSYARAWLFDALGSSG